jgi:magnesium transporter
MKTKKPKMLRSQKAGLPPGSLVHIGAARTAPPAISVLDFGPDGLLESELPDATALASWRRQNGALWGNVCGLQEAADLNAIGTAFALHPLVLEDILNNNQRQKADAYDHYLYVVLHRYEITNAPLDLVQDQISLIIGSDYLLSFQEHPSAVFEPVRERLRTDRGNLRSAPVDVLAYSLLDAVVDSYFAVVEQLDEHAENLQIEILGRPGPAVLESIHRFRRCVSQLRRNLYPLRELLASLNREHAHFFGPDIQFYLRDVYDHTVHILESLEDLREVATGLLDIHLTTVSQKVNLEVRALTVVATIFMPATLIAGIFGMNFHTMPWLERPAGFYYATGLMAIIACVMLVLFWRRR